jgi:alginate O-acetyltransferase complex protein AlgI
MLALCGALLWALKGVVAVEARAAGEPPLSLPGWCAFVVGWTGMRPGLFATLGGPPRAGAGALVCQGLRRLAVGAALVGAAWAVGAHGTALGEAPRHVVATLLLLPGLSLMVHFGLFNVLAGGWRYAGVACGPLFRAPLRARSLSEFWGRRWNLAFAEMTAVGVYRPLAARVGATIALAASFMWSGVLHEVAISVPVQAGLGLPMLYFVLHGGLVLVERWLEARGRPIYRVAWVGRVWTLAWLVLPLGILFHPAFLQEVVWPIVGLEPSGVR